MDSVDSNANALSKRDPAGCSGAQQQPPGQRSAYAIGQGQAAVVWHSTKVKGDDLVIRDVHARPTSMASLYERVNPMTIPGIRVVMDVGDDDEELGVRLPLRVVDRIPLLCRQKSCGTGGHHMHTCGAEASPNKGAGDGAVLRCGDVDHTGQIGLPGTLWDVFFVLKILLDSALIGMATRCSWIQKILLH